MKSDHDINEPDVLEQRNPTLKTCTTVAHEKYEWFNRSQHCLYRCACSTSLYCIFGVFVMYCGELSVLDPNKRRSRIFWNASWLLDCGRMSGSVHQDEYMRSYWLGANKHRANLLDSTSDIHEKYYDERSYCSLRAASRLPELVLLLIFIAVN